MCPCMPVRLGRCIRLLRRGEAGQSLIEYAIVIALIAVGLIAVLSLLRSAAGGVLNGTAETVSRQSSAGGYGSSGGSPSRGRPDPSDSSGGGNDSSGVGTQR
jgi:Flp pilus assembly pilin Flp